MDNYIKASFPNKSCNERLARVIATAFAIELDPTLDQLAEIKTAISEAVTNAIIHGYGDGEGEVSLECRKYGQTLEFIVTDTGKGIIDIEKAREPLYTGAPEMERSGMGFTIMETFMDTIAVKSTPNEGTSVTMRKTIKGCGAFDGEQ